MGSFITTLYVAATFVWEVVENWWFWWLLTFLVDVLESLDLRIPVEDNVACLIHDLLRLWSYINWATVCIDVTSSKVQIISLCSSGGKGDYVCVDTGALEDCLGGGSEETPYLRTTFQPTWWG